MTRRELKKMLGDKNYRLMERNIDSGTSYIEVSEDFRTWLVSQIKGLDITDERDNKIFFKHGYTRYYLEEKTAIPMLVENQIPANITWN